MGVISEKYRQEQQNLHENKLYGVASVGYAPVVAKLIQKLGITSLTDYGAGKQRLRQALIEQGIELQRYSPYDPAFPDYGPPLPSQLVCCIDVLEHVEIDCLEDVLEDIRSNVEKFCFLTIHTGPAIKKLSDGRNAHIIQAPSSWWLKKITDYFEISALQSTKGGLWILGTKKKSYLKINSVD